MPRIIAAILLVAVLAIGGGIIATTAYQAGLGTAVTTATGSGGTVVTPVVVPAYGYGYGWLASRRLRLRVLRLPRHAVLPVHRLRADPGDLLARRPGHAAAGAGRLGRLRLRQGPDGTATALGEPRHDTFDDWHRRAHGEPAAARAADDQTPADRHRLTA